MLILHYISFIVVIAALLVEHSLVKPVLPRVVIRNIVIADATYGTAFLLAFLSGLGLILWSDQTLLASLSTLKFWLTMGLFFIVGLASMYPTFRYLMLWKGELTELVELPANIIVVIRLELLAMAGFVWLGYGM